VSVESVLVALILSSVLASVFFGLTRALDALNGSGSSGPKARVAAVQADSSRHHGNRVA
jgi:hypothetical protein